MDGYAGYRRVAVPRGSAALAFCWAHARRKLLEVHESHRSPVAEEGLRRIAALYAIESEIRGASADERRTVRQARSAPLVADFGLWLRERRARVSPRSRLGEKLAYVGNHWDGLRVFLADGRVEMDSNAFENTIRPLALNRKNALFAGHDEGAAAWIVSRRSSETAKMNGVDPHAYLKATLAAIASGHPAAQIDQTAPLGLYPTFTLKPTPGQSTCLRRRSSPSS